MIKVTLPLLGLLLVGATSCQQSAPHSQEAQQGAITATALPTTAEAAREAVRRYLSTQPNASLFVPDSARVNDNGSSWQVLVPRTDWAQRMPNRARFEVDKATGTVSTASVK